MIKNSTPVGWIGLGKMGLPMCSRLLDTGYALTVYNRTAEKTKSLAKRGATVASSPEEVASVCPVVFSMVSDDGVLESVTLGEEGVLKGAREGSIFIDMSTVSPRASAKVAQAALQKGVRYLRAPVSGSTKFAEAGTLTLFVSGPRETYEGCAAVLKNLGQRFFYFGPGEEARYMKLLINMMVGTTALMVAEALTFGEKSGIDWQAMLDGIQNSAVGSPLFGYKAQTLRERNFTPNFTIDQITKDLDLALQTANTLHVPLPVTSLGRQFFEAMRSTGRGDWDFFGLLVLFEEISGFPKTKER